MIPRHRCLCCTRGCSPPRGHLIVGKAHSSIKPDVFLLGDCASVGLQVYVPYMAAIAANASSEALKAVVLTAAAQRLQRYNPNLGAYGGFPTGSSPRRCADQLQAPCTLLLC